MGMTVLGQTKAQSVKQFSTSCFRTKILHWTSSVDIDPTQYQTRKSHLMYGLFFFFFLHSFFYIAQFNFWCLRMRSCHAPFHVANLPSVLALSSFYQVTSESWGSVRHLTFDDLKYFVIHDFMVIICIQRPATLFQVMTHPLIKNHYDSHGIPDSSARTYPLLSCLSARSPSSVHLCFSLSWFPTEP